MNQFCSKNHPNHGHCGNIEQMINVNAQVGGYYQIQYRTRNYILSVFYVFLAVNRKNFGIFMVSRH